MREGGSVAEIARDERAWRCGCHRIPVHEAEASHGLENLSDGLERLRHPDDIDVHGESAAGIARVAVAPTRGRPCAVASWKGHQVRRYRLAHIRLAEPC